MKTALYRHFDAAGKLLYVGISNHPIYRTMQHGDTAGWFQRISRIDIEWFGSRESALEAEREAIKRENPKFNIAGRVRAGWKHEPYQCFGEKVAAWAAVDEQNNVLAVGTEKDEVQCVADARFEPGTFKVIALVDEAWLT